MNRVRTVLRAGALSLVLLAAAGPAPAVGATTKAGAAFLRGAHLSPDTAAVDVYLTSFGGGTTTLWLSRVGYGDVSSYERIRTGEYAVSMRPHGAAATTKAVLSWTINLQPGEAYTALAIGHQASLRGEIIKDSLSAPASGSGRVRVIQASSRAGRVNVAAGTGLMLGRDVPFGGITGYVTVPAGRWAVRVDSLSHHRAADQATLSVASKSVTSIVVLDGRHGGVQVRSLLDAAGAPTAPKGAVPAGGGGMAPQPASPRASHAGIVIGGAVLGLIAVFPFAGAVLRRRRGRALA
jgi:hypothetical protein